MIDEKYPSNNLSNTYVQENSSEILHRTKQNFCSEGTDVINPSKDVYGALIFLFEYFNQRLFHATLPNCIITLPKGRKTALGYFWGKNWARTNRSDVCDEIALNPMFFQGSSPERILSTLVHEMVHLQQCHFGKPGKGAYHNKEWGRLMRKVGLFPSSTGKEGGAETGRRVSHFIEEDGAFQRVCKELLEQGFTIPWHVISPPNKEKENDEEGNDIARKKRESKTKYTCPDCELKAWAKPNVFILCGTCQQELMAAAS